MTSSEAELRLHRTLACLAECGCRCTASRIEAEVGTIDFETRQALVLQGRFHPGCGFLELAWSVGLPGSFGPFLAGRMTSVMELCYEYGAYLSLVHQPEKIRIDLCQKLYFSALHYYSLSETLEDLGKAAAQMEGVLRPAGEYPGGP